MGHALVLARIVLNRAEPEVAAAFIVGALSDLRPELQSLDDAVRSHMAPE